MRTISQRDSYSCLDFNRLTPAMTVNQRYYLALILAGLCIGLIGAVLKEAGL